MQRDSTNPNTYLSGAGGTSGIYAEIIEEPKSDGTRFRYEKEGRSAGIIRGANSSEKHKTYPALKIHGGRGSAYVVITLVTVNKPYYQHPHKLVGSSCKDGIYSKYISDIEMTISFPDLGIQCVKREDVQESLAKREALQIDPFGNGFSYAYNPKKINFNAVKLCFQVLLPDSSGKFSIPIEPVLSAPIFDNKAVSDLAIVKLSHYSAPISGGQEVILLCGNVNKDDIEIIFYEEKDKKRIWSAKGKFSKDNVHRKTAISFETPAYENLDIEEEVNCFICLRRPSDGTEGHPKEFILLPIKEGDVNNLHSVHANLLTPMRDVTSEFNLPAATSIPGNKMYCENVCSPYYIIQKPGSTPNTNISPNVYQAANAFPCKSDPIKSNNDIFDVLTQVVEENNPKDDFFPHRNDDNATNGFNNLNRLPPAHQNDSSVFPVYQNASDKFPAASAPIGLNIADCSGVSPVDDTLVKFNSLEINKETDDEEMSSQDNEKVLQDGNTENLENLSGWDLNLDSGDIMQYSY